MFHMTGLTKSDQIVSTVCSLRDIKKPERFYMVDRKAFANMFSAIVAVSCLFGYYPFARRKPTTPAIGSRASDPISSKWTFWLRGVTAFDIAVIGRAILPSKPRLLFELNAATLADAVYSFLPFWVRRSANLIGREGVCWAQPFSELVPYQVGFGTSIQKGICLPATAARRRAKTRLIFPVWLNVECAAACLAMLFNHTNTIQAWGNIGNRTTLVACDRVQKAYDQPDLFVAPPTKPTQETLI